MLDLTNLTDLAASTNGHESSSDADLGFLLPRRHEPAEWWYYNGHLQAAERRFSFHVAFFRFRSAGFRIGKYVPVRLFGRHVGFAHVSLTEHQNNVTRFAHRRAFYFRSGGSKTNPLIRIKDWSVQLNPKEHLLRLGFDDCRLSLQLQPSKPIASYGDGGLFKSALPRVSSHCSYSRMSVSGAINVGRQDIDVEGTAWMDREFGEIGPDQSVAGWVWMSIQLDDGRELMVYRVKRRDRDEVCLKAALIDQRGDVRVLNDDALEIQPTRFWRSELMQAEYPVGWSLQLPSESLTLSVDAIHDAAEFDTRGTTNTVYWEGPAEVRGTQNGCVISGKAFMELVGFNQKKLFGLMDHTRRNLPLLGYFANETRFRFLGSSSFKIQR